MTSFFRPVVSGSCSMRTRSAPVIAAATASVMPAEAQAVTKPASPPLRRAITGLALRCRSLISTNSGRTSAAARTASGTAIEAPSPVMVPETLMIGRRPRRRRMSERITKLLLMLAEFDAAEERLEAIVLRIDEDVARAALDRDAPAVHEHDTRADVAREGHLVGHHDHGHALARELLHDAQHLADQLGVQRRSDLVEQQHFRPHRDGARDAHALLLAARELRRQRVEFRLEP